MKRKGFVMMETLVVMTALTIGLISIYSSYSVLLSRAKVSQSHETVDKIYKTYFISEYIKENVNMSQGLTIYNINSAPENIKFIMENFNMEKLYVFNSSQDFTQYIDYSILDGTSIAYFDIWDGYDATKYNFVAKYKTGDYPRESSEFASIHLIDDVPEEEASIVTSGLSTWFDFSSNSNDSPNKNIINDLSGNNRDGTLVNFDYISSSGWTGTGLYFDGLGDYVSSELGTYRTLEFIYNASLDQNAARYPSLFNHYPQTVTPFVWIFIDKAGASLYLQVNNTSTKTIGNFYQSETDCHLTIIFNTNDYLVYKDGQLVQTYSQSSTPPNTGASYIGTYGALTTHAFKGEMKLFRAYNRALTAAEVKNNYNLSKQ